MDINAGIKQTHSEEDDFDYIYHLPHADPDRIIFRDPFAKDTNINAKKFGSTAMLSMMSKNEVKAIREVLNPTSNASAHRVKSIMQLATRRRGTTSASSVGLATSASVNSSLNFSETAERKHPNRKPSSRLENSSSSHLQDIDSLRVSVIVDKTLLPISNRNLHVSRQLYPLTGTSNISKNSIEKTTGRHLDLKPLLPLPRHLSKHLPILDNFEEDTHLVIEPQLIAFKEASTFRALPVRITQYIPAMWIAISGFVIMSLAVLQVVIEIAR